MQVDAGEAAAWLGVIVSVVFSTIALGVSLLALKYQRESAQAAKRAVEEAARSADASEASAQAGVRSALAAERSAVAAEQVVEIESLRDMQPTVGWTLTRAGKQLFVLRNIGTETATGVTVTASTGRLTNAPQGVEVQADASVSFLISGGMGDPAPNEVSVSWDGMVQPALVPVPTM